MAFRFLFDEHVSVPACRALRGRGVDVVHVLEFGMKTALDPQVLDRAAAEGRIVVRRNYDDFVGLVTAYVEGGRHFPGVLLLPVSVRQSDVGAHVRAVERWIEERTAADPGGAAAGQSPIADTFGWLRGA